MIVILIYGIEIDVADWIGEERCVQNIKMNAVVDEMWLDTTTFIYWICVK